MFLCLGDMLVLSCKGTLFIGSVEASPLRRPLDAPLEAEEIDGRQKHAGEGRTPPRRICGDDPRDERVLSGALWAKSSEKVKNDLR